MFVKGILSKLSRKLPCFTVVGFGLVRLSVVTERFVAVLWVSLGSVGQTTSDALGEGVVLPLGSKAVVNVEFETDGWSAGVTLGESELFLLTPEAPALVLPVDPPLPLPSSLPSLPFLSCKT